jgi:hypothetical protein
MSADGQVVDDTAQSQVLRWPGRVLAGADLRGRLNGHREVLLPQRTVVTPLAEELLRANGVRVTRQPPEASPAPTASWGYAQERPHPLVASAVRAVEREGLALQELRTPSTDLPYRWARAVAECVIRGECQGGVIFCPDPGLVCCVANKLAGLRAIAVTTVAQAAGATLQLGANLVAVEMPGRTFFEVRQIFRTLCTAGQPRCPPGVACTLGELDGHAHR